MEKMPCSPYIMHRRYSVELCTEGVQSSHFTKVDCYEQKRRMMYAAIRSKPIKENVFGVL